MSPGLADGVLCRLLQRPAEHVDPVLARFPAESARLLSLADEKLEELAAAAEPDAGPAAPLTR